MNKRISWVCLIIRISKVLIGLLILVLQSCTNPKISPTPTYSPPGRWFEELSSDPHCQLPCWANIVPGKTRVTEAYELLKNKIGLDDLKLVGPNNYPTGPEYQISWKFRDDKSEGLISTKKASDIVSLLSLRSNNEIPLSIVFGKLGEPEKIYIYVGESLIYPEVFLLYSATDMVLRWGGITEKGLVNISKELRVYRIELYQKGVFEENLNKLRISNQDTDWKGFGVYKYSY